MKVYCSQGFILFECIGKEPVQLYCIMLSRKKRKPYKPREIFIDEIGETFLSTNCSLDASELEKVLNKSVVHNYSLGEVEIWFHQRLQASQSLYEIDLIKEFYKKCSSIECTP